MTHVLVYLVTSLDQNDPAVLELEDELESRRFENRGIGWNAHCLVDERGVWAGVANLGTADGCFHWLLMHETAAIDWGSLAYHDECRRVLRGHVEGWQRRQQEREQEARTERRREENRRRAKAILTSRRLRIDDDASATGITRRPGGEFR